MKIFVDGGHVDKNLTWIIKIAQNNCAQYEYSNTVSLRTT